MDYECCWILQSLENVPRTHISIFMADMLYSAHVRLLTTTSSDAIIGVKLKRVAQHDSCHYFDRKLYLPFFEPLNRFAHVALPHLVLSPIELILIAHVTLPCVMLTWIVLLRKVHIAH